MITTSRAFSYAAFLASAGLLEACSGAGGTVGGAGGNSTGSGGTGTTGVAGGTTGSSGGTGTSGSPGAGAGPSSGSGGNPGSASGGSTGTGTGGSAGTPSTGAAGSPGAAGGGPITVPLDCGASGIAVEAHGNPNNRINYVIVGDGYSQADLDSGLYLSHINKMISDPTRTFNGRASPVGRWLPAQEPYARYRNFVNICALKVPSVDSGIKAGPAQSGATPTTNTAFDGYGNDTSRLGYITNSKVTAAIRSLLPATIMVDWTGVVLNDASWWNSGGNPMVWSGANPDAGLAPQHEGGHGFFKLADEYGGTQAAPTTEPREINVTINPTTTANKWNLWLGFTQTPGTGLQGAIEGARYADTGVFRPSDQSVMNSLWSSAAYNSVSLENAVHEIYKLVRPIDSSTAATVTTPQVLNVAVIDPAVIKVDWSVDGAVVAANGGANFDVAAKGLAAGSHQISARAYDDTPWVRGARTTMEQTVQWTISVP